MDRVESDYLRLEQKVDGVMQLENPADPIAKLESSAPAIEE